MSISLTFPKKGTESQTIEEPVVKEVQEEPVMKEVQEEPPAPTLRYRPSENGGKNKSLTLDQRQKIQEGIEKGDSKVSISKEINKDKSTVGKEIKLHRRKVAAHEGNPFECTNYSACIYGHDCRENCDGLSPFVCRRRDRTPGACNGCSMLETCPYDKYLYNAKEAHERYKTLLVESRRGINMSQEDIDKMWLILKPCMEMKMSIAEIVEQHPELGVCQKTLYNYLNNGVFPVDRKGNAWKKDEPAE